MSGRHIMRRSVLFSTVMALAVASTLSAIAADEGAPSGGTGKHKVAQQCLDGLQKFDEELWHMGFGVLEEGIVPPGTYGASAPSGYSVWGVDETPRQKLRSLRDAAYVYAMDGNEQACEMLLASMRKVYDEHQRVLGTEADDPKVNLAWQRAHLARAKPVAGMNHLVRADILIGGEVRNLKDQGLGEIEDLVLNPEKQQILYVLVSRGGFLGLDGKLVPVRWNDLRVTDGHALYVLDVSPKAFEAAPIVEGRDFKEAGDPDWQRSLNRYWDQVVK